jgi:hypothetical protein
MIKLRRRDTDGLVAGHRVEADPALDDVDTFLDAMRTEFGATPPPEPRPTLASTLDGRRPLRPASGPRVHTTFPERRPRRRGALRPVAVVAAAGAVLFGGLATAGALPGPVQRTTADVTSHVGIDLPGHTDAHPASRVEVDPGRTGTPRTSVPRTATTTAPTAPTAPSAPTPTTVPAPSAPTIPTVPSLPRPAPTPTTAPNLLGQVLAPLAANGPTGPTGPEGPTAPHPLRDLLGHLVP